MQLGRDAHRVGRDADLAGEVVEQVPVGGREGLALLTRAQAELTDLLGLVDEWQMDDVASGVSITRDDFEALALPERDCGIG